MSETKIIQKGDPVLRKTAEAVPLAEINKPTIQKIVERMKQALENTEDGVAIAAPQIGESLRIFVVRGVVFRERGDVGSQDKVFINPELINTTNKKEVVDEGCLSVKNVYGEIKRAPQATVRAYNLNGEKFEMGASGLLAQIFQHEIEHLDGILFTDKAKNLREVKPEEVEQDM